LYEETDSNWVEISYPDVTSNSWEMDDLIVVNEGQEVLRLSETGAWRHLVKINLASGKVTDLTPGNYDLATCYTAAGKYAWFSASPTNSMQRYLYRVSLSGKGDTVRVTPSEYAGINLYKIAPEGNYALHTHTSLQSPSTTELIRVQGHQTIKVLTANTNYKQKISRLRQPLYSLFTVNTADGIAVDGIMMQPPGFDRQRNTRYCSMFTVNPRDRKRPIPGEYFGI
jgi:dipeptidyl-peptidase-4